MAEDRLVDFDSMLRSQRWLLLMLLLPKQKRVKAGRAGELQQNCLLLREYNTSI